MIDTCEFAQICGIFSEVANLAELAVLVELCDVVSQLVFIAACFC